MEDNLSNASSLRWQVLGRDLQRGQLMAWMELSRTSFTRRSSEGSEGPLAFQKNSAVTSVLSWQSLRHWRSSAEVSHSGAWTPWSRPSNFEPQCWNSKPLHWADHVCHACRRFELRTLWYHSFMDSLDWRCLYGFSARTKCWSHYATFSTTSSRWTDLYDAALVSSTLSSSWQRVWLSRCTSHLEQRSLPPTAEPGLHTTWLRQAAVPSAKGRPNHSCHHCLCWWFPWHK